ncbi:MAG: EAL domain-containing protein [Rhodocyclaceae bacterium]
MLAWPKAVAAATIWPFTFVARWTTGAARSIRRRAELYIIAFQVLLCLLSAVVIAQLFALDSHVDSVDKRWVTGTRILGQLGSRLDDFRMAETARILAVDDEGRRRAETRAVFARESVDHLLDEYEQTVGPAKVGPMEAFRKAVRSYFSAHDHWMQSMAKADVVTVRHTYDTVLGEYFTQTTDAVDQLIQMNARESRAETERSDQIVDSTITVVAFLTVAAMLFGVWLQRRVQSMVTRPIESITLALTRLAAGDHTAQVPEVHREDEIGSMAKALDVFRANARALERAHEATRIAKKRAQHLAKHDPLTGLANRRALTSELATAIERAVQSDKSDAGVWLFVIDLDGFKPVNDIYGHVSGDAVLRELARRLRVVVEEDGLLSRLGGDEFAVVMRDVGDDGATRLASRMIEAIQAPIFVAGAYVELGASIGIAACPRHARDVESLLRAADIAMYSVKRERLGGHRFFEAQMDEDLRARAAIEVILRAAVENQQIVPHYQPLIDMRDGRVHGFEILARWHHPARGDISPDIFIPLAERIGLMKALTASVLRRACRDARHWPAGTSLALNISPTQLVEPELPFELLPILQEEGFAPERLEIEVTETALISDVEAAKSALASFRRLGMKISLDDFGTGYSSLHHLHVLKFDKVKIDRSFVQSMRFNVESQKIVDAILSLSRNLGMATIAEGIEEAEVSDMLAERGCEFGQGFYFGRAMPADAVSHLFAPPAQMSVRTAAAA